MGLEYDFCFYWLTSFADYNNKLQLQKNYGGIYTYFFSHTGEIFLVFGASNYGEGDTAG